MRPLEELALDGTVRDRLPGNITQHRVLEDYEGPILTEHRSNALMFIEKWCAYHNESSRSIFTRTDARSLALYLAGQLTMRSLLTKNADGVCHVVDRHLASSEVRSCRALLSEVKHHLPEQGVFHDISLRPQWQTVPHSYIVSNNWDGKTFSKIERRHLGASAFAILAANDSSNAGDFPAPPLKYEYNGGYPYKHMFSRVADALPERLRARSGSVFASSPGVYTIETPQLTSFYLHRAIEASAYAANEYKNVHEWSKRLKKKKKKLRLPAHARLSLEKLCSKLHISLERLTSDDNQFIEMSQQSDLLGTEISQPEDSHVSENEKLWRAAKIITFYYRTLLLFRNNKDGYQFLAGGTARQTEMTLEEPDDF